MQVESSTTFTKKSNEGICTLLFLVKKKWSMVSTNESMRSL